MTTEKPLTDRQEKILAFIKQTTSVRGYPPSVREIGDAVGLKSPSSVHSQLNRLQERGLLRKDTALPRSIVLSAEDAEEPLDIPGTKTVPLLGEIAAGSPLVANEQVSDRFALPKQVVGEGTLFMLRVRGDSMIEAGVFDDDYVVVRQQPTVEQGEMCAALIEGEATVKFFRRTPSGEVFLDPANEAYEPIPVPPDQTSSIVGRVTAVLRSL